MGELIHFPRLPERERTPENKLDKQLIIERLLRVTAELGNEVDPDELEGWEGLDDQEFQENLITFMTLHDLDYTTLLEAIGVPVESIEVYGVEVSRETE